MAIAAANGRKAGRREVTAEDENVANAKGNSVVEIQKLIGASRATVYRRLKM